MPNIKPVSDLRNYNEAVDELLSELEKGEKSAAENGWLIQEDVEKELGLLNNLDVNKKEAIISTLKREPFDYTEWRRNKFDDMTAEELNRAAAEYGRLNHNNT